MEKDPTKKVGLEKRIGMGVFRSIRKDRNNKSPAGAGFCFNQLFTIYTDYPTRNKFFCYIISNLQVIYN